MKSFTATMTLMVAIWAAAAGTALTKDIRWEPWSESRPWLPGERSEAVVPDTLDLVYRAELAINTITGEVDLDEPGVGEVWSGGRFSTDPPHMVHTLGEAGVMEPKIAGPIAALRVMTGSALNLDAEKEMVDWLVRGLSKEDGLLYSLAKPDRPWYSMADKPIPEGNCDYAYIYGQICMMKFMIAYYQYTRDPIWKARIDKMIEGIDKKMAFHKTDSITGKKYAYMPFDGGVTKGYSTLGSCMPRSGWKEGGREPLQEEDSATEGSVFMDIGPYPGVLAQWYRMSGNRRALELAEEFKNFMMQKKFWGAGKDPLGLERGAELGHWDGHFFGHMEALRGLLEYAIVTNDAATKKFVCGGYEWAKHSNTWPQPWVLKSDPPSPIPAIGFFDAHCGCTAPRMAALAIRLSDAGVGDYWEDVDRYVRNNMIEVQTIDRTRLQKIVEGKARGASRPPIATEDRVLERNIGGFCILGAPTEIMLPKIPYNATCCLPHGSWGLYYAWEGIVRRDKDTATVNLLLNRASPWLDIDSYLPYEGKVVIRNKTAKTLLLRIPTWADKTAVRCKRNGKSAEFAWAGNYIQVNGLRKKENVTIEFPMVEWTEKHYQHTFTFKGNTVVDVSPRESAGGYPIYLRDFMKSDKAPMKKITRYVSPLLIKW